MSDAAEQSPHGPAAEAVRREPGSAAAARGRIAVPLRILLRLIVIALLMLILLVFAGSEIDFVYTGF